MAKGTTIDTVQFSRLACERIAACLRSLDHARDPIETLASDAKAAKATLESRQESLSAALTEIEEAAAAREKSAGRKVAAPWTAEECTRVSGLHRDVERAEKQHTAAHDALERQKKLVKQLEAELYALTARAVQGGELFDEAADAKAEEPWRGIHLSDVMGEPNAQPYAEHNLTTIGQVLDAWHGGELRVRVGTGDITQVQSDFLTRTIRDFFERRGLPMDGLPEAAAAPKGKGKKSADAKAAKPDPKAGANLKLTDAPQPAKGKKGKGDSANLRLAPEPLIDAKGRIVPSFALHTGLLGSPHAEDAWADTSFLQLRADGVLRFPSSKPAEILEALTVLIDEGVTTPADLLQKLIDLTGTPKGEARIDTIFDGSFGVPADLMHALLQLIAMHGNNTGHPGVYLATLSLSESLPRGIWARLAERVPLLGELATRPEAERYARDVTIREAKALRALGKPKKPSAKKPAASKAPAKKAAKKPDAGKKGPGGKPKK